MIVSRRIGIAWLCTFLLSAAAAAQSHAVSVSAGPGGAAQLTLTSRAKVTVSKEPGQVNISSALIGPDGTAGWLAEFRAEGVSYPFAQILIVWKNGGVIRRFPSDQAFYSWTFYAGGKQVAFHTGPLHGEQKSHCELHDAASGRLLASWDGDMESATRPPWAKGLTH